VRASLSRSLGPVNTFCSRSFPFLKPLGPIKIEPSSCEKLRHRPSLCPAFLISDHAVATLFPSGLLWPWRTEDSLSLLIACSCRLKIFSPASRFPLSSSNHFKARPLVTRSGFSHWNFLVKTTPSVLVATDFLFPLMGRGHHPLFCSPTLPPLLDGLFFCRLDAVTGCPTCFLEPSIYHQFFFFDIFSFPSLPSFCALPREEGW